MNRLEYIRQQERLSHTEAYTTYGLYQQGSWLAKPVKTVLECLPFFENYTSLRVLDLGSGVGRNSIAIARRFRHIPCRIDCVDILDLALEKLRENAENYGVSRSIRGYVTALENYPIPEDQYDLVLGISALEHAESEEAFIRTLEGIRDGIRKNGIVCVVINSDVQEADKLTGAQLPVQFEVNLSQDRLEFLLESIFAGWTVLKSGVREQRYDIPRENLISDLRTQVVTFVAKKV